MAALGCWAPALHFLVGSALGMLRGFGAGAVPGDSPLGVPVLHTRRGLGLGGTGVASGAVTAFASPQRRSQRPYLLLAELLSVR